MEILGQICWPNITVRVLGVEGPTDVRCYIRNRDVERNVHAKADGSCISGNRGAMMDFISHLTRAMSICVGSMSITESNKPLFVGLRNAVDESFDAFDITSSAMCRIRINKDSSSERVAGFVNRPDSTNSEFHIRSATCSGVSEIRTAKRCRSCHEVPARQVAVYMSSQTYFHFVIAVASLASHPTETVLGNIISETLPCHRRNQGMSVSFDQRSIPST